MLMEQRTVTNSAFIQCLNAGTFKSAMQCSLRLAPTMINHLTSMYLEWCDMPVEIQETRWLCLSAQCDVLCDLKLGQKSWFTHTKRQVGLRNFLPAKYCFPADSYSTEIWNALLVWHTSGVNTLLCDLHTYKQLFSIDINNQSILTNLQ